MSTAGKKSLKMAQDAKPKPEFYRRVLPDGCIAFSSTEGRAIFREALMSGHMECYFKMAAQFSTQAEPAFCGLTTLVMVLNALEVDPGKVWKGPWRWYHEDMLECCISLDVMKENGITFDQFVCLAACNSLEVDSSRIDASASLETFRNDVIRLSKCDDRFIALSYSRKILGQTGDGHFSPIGGYHPDKDLVLVMDTARFKYPPHWVPITIVWEAMKPLDHSTGKSRGYCILSKVEKEGPLRLFKLSKSFSVFLPCACTSGISTFVHKWRGCLTKAITSMPLECNDVKLPSDNVEIFGQVVSLLLESACSIAQSECILSTFMDLASFSKEHNALKEALLKQIECMDIYNIVHKVLQTADSSTDSCFNIGITGESKALPSGRGCCGQSPSKCAKISDTEMLPAHFITVFVLCWPYELFKVTEETTVADKLDEYVTKWMESTASRELKGEVSQLKRQLLVLLKMRMKNQSQSESAASCSNQ